jgi:hypothetical protein
MLKKILNPVTNINTGLAGQFFVCYEFARRGYHVGHLLGNSKDIDVLLSHPENGNQYRLQIKTTSGAKPEWVLNKKVENLAHENLYYVLVVLGDETPSCHIVPSKELSVIVSESHQSWLNKPGKNGTPHKDNLIRKFKDCDKVYLNKWEYFQ